MYQTEEKRLSGNPHFHHVPAISQSPNGERPDGRGAQGHLVAVVTSQSHQTHRGRPGDLPKGEVAVVEVTIPNTLTKCFLGKVSTEFLEKHFPLHLLANRRVGFGIKQS